MVGWGGDGVMRYASWVGWVGLVERWNGGKVGWGGGVSNQL